MINNVLLIDYGCHSFTHNLAVRLYETGYPFRYMVNGSLESPNLQSLSSWRQQHPELVKAVSCRNPYGKTSLRARLKGELAWADECLKALESEKPAAIILSCVPLTAAFRIQRWARQRNIPLIYWLQDLQGQAILDLLGRKLGVVGRLTGYIAKYIERHILDHSDMIITIAPQHERSLPLAVRSNRRFRLLENWANIEDIPVLPCDNEWSRKHNLHKTKNVLYAGTLGYKHDLNVFISLAAAFKNRDDVRVVVVSSGQAADHLSNEAIRYRLDNLIILPFQDHKDVSRVLATASILIAPLDPSAGSFCVPSKVLSYICAGRPVVLAINFDNPAAEMIRSAGSGVVISPGSTEEFVNAVKKLLDNYSQQEEFGRNGREHAERNFKLDIVVGRFIELLGAAGIQPQKNEQSRNLLITQSTATCD